MQRGRWISLLSLGWLGLSGIATPATVQADPVVPEARIESARGMALGTGVRASSQATQAQADNPANIAAGALAHIETLFAYHPQLKSYSVGASVVDSMTSRVAAGMSSRFLFGENSAGEHSGWEGRVSLAVPIGDMLALGLAARYANLTVSNPHARPEGTYARYRASIENPPEDEVEPDQSFKLKAFSLDAAVTLRPFDGFTLSALGYNLIDPGTPLAPMMVGGGVSFGKNGLALGADVLVDLNLHKAFPDGPKLQVGGGLEYLTQGLAPLRVGYVYDQGRHTHAVTGGLGYIDHRFGIQLSLRQVVNGDHKDTTLFSSAQYFVQ